MGAPMAGRLCDAGYTVGVWNRTVEKAKPLKERGATVCAVAADSTRDADIVILMVLSGAACDELLFGADGTHNALHLREGSLVIAMSSIDVDTARTHASRLAEFGVRYIDAPVSGGERGAVEGTLSIMAGGAQEDIEMAHPLLETMGSLTHVGPVGCGQVAKLANQLIVGATIGAVAEAFILAAASGANATAVQTALIGGFADSTILRQHGQRMVDEDFTPGAHATTQLKDLNNAATLADQVGLRLPYLQLTKRLYEEMCDTEMRALDHSALYLKLRGGQ